MTTIFASILAAVVSLAVLPTPVPADANPTPVVTIERPVADLPLPPVDIAPNPPPIVIVDPYDENDPVTRWIGLISVYFPAQYWSDALAIIACESGGVEEAVNRQGSGALGLFQIKPQYWGFLLEPGESLLDGETNIRIASILVASSVAQGERPWHWWACERVLGRAK